MQTEGTDNYYSSGTAALKLRGQEAKTLIFTVAQEEEWQPYAPKGKVS
jgi:hypothetical protein